MRWEEEPYVRLYTRDTTNWALLSWQAQGLFSLVMRKVDRAGVLELGRHGKRALSAHIGGPAAWAELEPVLEELLADGCIEIHQDGDRSRLVIPNFLEAQEARRSDRMRQSETRARRRDEARNRDTASQNVTPSHASENKQAHAVTESHTENPPSDNGHETSLFALHCSALLPSALHCGERVSEDHRAQSMDEKREDLPRPNSGAVILARAWEEVFQLPCSVADLEEPYRLCAESARVTGAEPKQHAADLVRAFAAWRTALAEKGLERPSPSPGKFVQKFEAIASYLREEGGGARASPGKRAKSAAAEMNRRTVEAEAKKLGLTYEQHVANLTGGGA